MNLSDDKNHRLFNDLDLQKSLTQARRGLEKESLRMSSGGYLSAQPHPHKLGASLTHPYITTDYSEALLEFITPPVSSAQEAIDWLMDIHTFTYQQIPDEMLWSCSMPCTLTAEADIPIANYGTSNVGMMKHIYRRGLAHRYGKNMQMIAGIHFNYSLPDTFWQNYQRQQNDHQPLKDFINQQYFHLIRNYWRYCWLIIVLTGASPALCQSFIRQQNSELKSLSPHTLYAPESTSLRMSDLGYQNKKQHAFSVSYNSLDEYLNDLTFAVSTPEPQYATYGCVADGSMEQLTTHLLQIEAEHYSPIRPKRRPHENERPIKALRERGVEYLEVRILDLNPYEPVGISPQTLCFIECFLLMCLQKASPIITKEEQQHIRNNLQQVVYHGQNGQTTLYSENDVISIETWGNQLLADMQPIAALLDQTHETDSYSASLEIAKQQFTHKDQLPSAKILHDITQYHEGSFVQFGHYWSEQHKQLFSQRSLSAEKQALFKKIAEKSVQQQQDIEKHDQLSLQKYVAQYLTH